MDQAQNSNQGTISINQRDRMAALNVAWSQGIRDKHELAERSGYSIKTVNKYYDQLEQGIKVERKKYVRESKLTDQMLEVVEIWLEESPYQSTRQLCIRLLNEHNITIKKSQLAYSNSINTLAS